MRQNVHLKHCTYRVFWPQLSDTEAPPVLKCPDYCIQALYYICVHLSIIRLCIPRYTGSLFHYLQACAPSCPASQTCKTAFVGSVGGRICCAGA